MGRIRRSRWPGKCSSTNISIQSILYSDSRSRLKSFQKTMISVTLATNMLILLDYD
jgi:hypothetical protein